MMYPGRRDGPRCPICGEGLRKGGHRLWGREVIFCPNCGLIDDDGIGRFE